MVTSVVHHLVAVLLHAPLVGRGGRPGRQAELGERVLNRLVEHDGRLLAEGRNRQVA